MTKTLFALVAIVASGAQAMEVPLDTLRITNEKGVICEFNGTRRLCQEQMIPELKLVENGNPNPVFTQFVKDFDTQIALEGYNHIFIREFIFDTKNARVTKDVSVIPFVAAIKWQRQALSQKDPVRQGTLFARGILTIKASDQGGFKVQFGQYADSQRIEKAARVLNFWSLEAQELDNATLNFLNKAVGPSIAGYTSALVETVIGHLAKSLVQK